MLDLIEETLELPHSDDEHPSPHESETKLISAAICCPLRNLPSA